MKVDCQWGRAGAARAADVTVIVDVLSFSTAVTVAVERGARVFPFWGPYGDAETLAALVGARLAARRRARDTLSLSPASLTSMAAGESVVLPSPNGSRCSLEAKGRDVLCGCLRNAEATAKLAREAQSVLVVAAGELWPDGAMRVAYEDMIGAGAIISHLGGELTPEARAAAAAFADAKADLRALLLACPSGVELVERGYGEDVELAAQFNASAAAPMLMQHRARYPDALGAAPDGAAPEGAAAEGAAAGRALAMADMAGKRVRYYEDAA